MTCSLLKLLLVPIGQHGLLIHMTRVAPDSVRRVGDWVNRHFAMLGSLALVLAVCGLVGVAHVLVSAQVRRTEETRRHPDRRRPCSLRVRDRGRCR